TPPCTPSPPSAPSSRRASCRDRLAATSAARNRATPGTGSLPQARRSVSVPPPPTLALLFHRSPTRSRTGPSPPSLPRPPTRGYGSAPPCLSAHSLSLR